MKSKHTPGPWKHDDTWGLIVATDGSEIAACHAGRTGSATETKANACLIASAPELLEALKGVLAVADRRTKEFDAARAAIAKAQGQD